MAKTGAVWGIDIGQCALKALRCKPHESDPQRVVVEAFDYVEYPKLLSQPDADRAELVREAIETFLSRNELKGDRVAVSVPGQSGLARYIKLPPVEAKKIPDIVKYEARQQIPFALEDVVWDYQPLAGGTQEEGFALETEIGLFAMKRDQVARALEPLMAAGIEVDFVQLAPLAVYNFTCFDRLRDLDNTEFNPASPPPSIVVLSIGTDTTDLVVTNGFRVWQRNIPLGGSHFTKALTKELKLTFSKAEHLKRNATQAEDPKAVFQAMRPVFSELVGEVNRSISFFSSSNKTATLSEVLTLGNAMKLPGLQRYLAQNLDIPVKTIEQFEGLVGGSVTAQPAFEENKMSFPVAYGLCVQALDRGRLSTNLLPSEIVTQRIIRAKKPWAAAAAAVLLAGLATSYVQYTGAWKTVADDIWKAPLGASQAEATRVGAFESRHSELTGKFESIGEIGTNLKSNNDGRLLWLELLKAIDTAMPRDPRPLEQRERSAADVTKREEIHVQSIDCQKFEDLSQWFTTVEPLWKEAQLTQEERIDAEKKREEAAKLAAAPAAGEAPAEGDAADAPADELAADEAAAGEELAEDPAAADPMAEDPMAADGGEGAEGGAGPTGAGWVLQIVGHHFHNDGGNEGTEFVRSTLIKNLTEGSIKLPDGPSGEVVDVPFSELGIGFPVVVTTSPIIDVTYDPEAGTDDEAGAGGAAPRMPAGAGMGIGGMRGEGGGIGPDGGEDLPEPERWKLRRYDFVVQFTWTPTPRHKRQEIRAGGGEEGAAEGEDFAAAGP
ncbi:MAG: type IV pilus assembly protein PilM [Lacipirellulaceae bacterium]